MLQQYTFIVSRPKSLTKSPRSHSASCSIAKLIKRPLRTVTCHGSNALDALADYEIGVLRSNPRFILSEPCSVCLGSRKK